MTDNVARHSPYTYIPPRLQRISPSSYRLTNEIVVGSSQKQAFEFCRDTRFLNEISPAILQFRPRNQPGIDVEINVGTEIEYDMRLHRIPVRWRSRIPVFEPPHRFIDEQLIGPYIFWSHTHTFKPIAGHNTAIGDVVEYTLPGGAMLAAVAQFVFVKRDLKKVFSHRSMKYREYLGEPLG